jgi:hypothetical protein
LQREKLGVMGGGPAKGRRAVRSTSSTGNFASRPALTLRAKSPFRVAVRLAEPCFASFGLSSAAHQSEVTMGQYKSDYEITWRGKVGKA